MTRWKETINLKDVFHDESKTFEQRRDLIVARLRASRWLKRQPENSAITGLVNLLAEAEHVRYFDADWNALYDYADRDQIWIATF